MLIGTVNQVPDRLKDQFASPLQLPIGLEVVVHDQESKSSGLQLVALADPVHSTRYPKELARAGEIPSTWNPASAALVYPSADAVTLFDLDAKQLKSLRTLVLADCRWGQGPASPLFQETCLKDIPIVIKLAHPPSASRFWRS